jgi:methylmalonyl-CoA/ethylmalonyl-CoA epimerase
MITGVNHIGIAVKDLNNSISVFSKILGTDKYHTETVAEQKVNVASFNIGGVLIELTAPTSEDSPIAKFIEKKGEGIHHIGFESDNVKDELVRLKNDGLQLIDNEPRFGAHEMLIAFLHPKSTNSVLTEICQHK